MSVNFPFPSSPHWAPRMIVAIMSSCYSIDQYCQLLAQPMQTTHLRSSKREWWGGILTLCITLCTCMAGFSDPCEWGSVYRSTYLGSSQNKMLFGCINFCNTSNMWFSSSHIRNPYLIAMKFIMYIVHVIFAFHHATKTCSNNFSAVKSARQICRLTTTALTESTLYAKSIIHRTH